MKNYKKLRDKGIKIREDLESLRMDFFQEENVKYRWSTNILGIAINTLGEFLKVLSEEDKTLNKGEK